MKKSFYRRNLPHIIPDDAQFFITFTLNGALPRAVIERLQNEKEDRLILLWHIEKSACFHP